VSGGGRERDGRRGGQDHSRETWRQGGPGAPYGDLELNANASGVRDFGAPHDYAYHPQAGHELDPDYLHWREEQMRAHDRDYHEWRKAQRERYDEDYRRFRAERREHFGRTFHQWRSQCSLVGGVPDTTVAPGVSGYGDRTGIPGGYNLSFGAPRPSGQLEAPTHLSGDPAMQQTGGSTYEASTAGRQAGADTSPEFGKEPPQVQASADGEARPDRNQQREDKPPRR
jgi:hypothetical protein